MTLARRRAPTPDIFPKRPEPLGDSTGLGKEAARELCLAAADLKEVKQSNPAREAAKRALAICGGARSLCARLGVNGAKLQAWLEGEEIPRPQLLKIIEIVLADHDAWRGQDRRSEPRAHTPAPTRQPAGVL